MDRIFTWLEVTKSEVVLLAGSGGRDTTIVPIFEITISHLTDIQYNIVIYISPPLTAPMEQREHNASSQKFWSRIGFGNGLVGLFPGVCGINLEFSSAWPRSCSLESLILLPLDDLRNANTPKVCVVAVNTAMNFRNGTTSNNPEVGSVKKFEATTDRKYGESPNKAMLQPVAIPE